MKFVYKLLINITLCIFSGVHAMQPAQSVRHKVVSTPLFANQFSSLPSMEKLLANCLPLPAVLVRICNDYVGTNLKDPKDFLACGIAKIVQFEGCRASAMFMHNNQVVAAIIDKDRYLHLYDITDKACKWHCTLESHRVEPEDRDPHNGLYRIYYGGGKIAVGTRVWDIETGKVVQKFPTTLLGISSDGTKVCRAFEQNKLGIYDIDKKTKLVVVAYSLYQCDHGLLAVKNKKIHDTCEILLYNLNRPESPCFKERFFKPTSMKIVNANKVCLKNDKTCVVTSEGKVFFEIQQDPIDYVNEGLQVKNFGNMCSYITRVLLCPDDTIYCINLLYCEDYSCNIFYKIDVKRIVSLGCFDKLYLKSLIIVLAKAFLHKQSQPNEPFVCTDEDSKILNRLRKFDPCMYDNLVNFFKINTDHKK